MRSPLRSIAIISFFVVVSSGARSALAVDTVTVPAGYAATTSDPGIIHLTPGALPRIGLSANCSNHNTYGVFMQSNTDARYATKTFVGNGWNPSIPFSGAAGSGVHNLTWYYDYTITTCDLQGNPMPGTVTFYVAVDTP